jgi:hypothetical protein
MIHSDQSLRKTLRLYPKTLRFYSIAPKNTPIISENYSNTFISFQKLSKHIRKHSNCAQNGHCQIGLRTRLNSDTIFDYSVIHSSHKPQFRYFSADLTVKIHKTGKSGAFLSRFGMGAAHSSYAPRIHSICYYARRIVTLSPVLSWKLCFVICRRNRVCRCMQYAHTVVVIVLICSVSQLGSGHSDQKLSVNIVDDFDFAALSGDELLTRKYGLDFRIILRFDGDNSVLDDCRVAVGSVNCWDYLFEFIAIPYLFRSDESCFP